MPKNPTIHQFTNFYLSCFYGCLYYFKSLSFATRSATEHVWGYLTVKKVKYFEYALFLKATLL